MLRVGRMLRIKIRGLRRRDLPAEAPSLVPKHPLNREHPVESPAILMPACRTYIRLRMKSGVIFCSVPVSTVR